MTKDFDNKKIFKRLEDTDRVGTDTQEVDNYVVKDYQMWVSGEAHFQTFKSDEPTEFKYPSDINHGLSYEDILLNDHTATSSDGESTTSDDPSSEKIYQKGADPTKITFTSHGLTGDFRGDQKAGPNFISNNFPSSGIVDAEGLDDLAEDQKSFAKWNAKGKELMSVDELKQYQINGSGMGSLSTYSTSDSPIKINEFISEQDMLTAKKELRADHILAPIELKWVDEIKEESEEE